MNAEERRLRAGWRILCFGALYLVLAAGMQVAISALIHSFDLPTWITLVLSSSGYLLATLLAVSFGRRWLDKRSTRGLGLAVESYWWTDLLFGVVLGAALMAAVFVAHQLTGWSVISSFAWQKDDKVWLLLQTLSYVFLYGVVAINEELVNRGYVLQNLEDGSSLPVAAVVSSVLFGLLHSGNPNASWFSTLAIVLAGFFLASGYLATRSLWLPIGLHFSWNLFQGTIFGFAVSGTSGFHLIEQQVTGPRWFTGGAFGPEAGFTGIGAMVLGTIAIFLWGRCRLRWSERDRVLVTSPPHDLRHDDHQGILS